MFTEDFVLLKKIDKHIQPLGRFLTMTFVVLVATAVLAGCSSQKLDPMVADEIPAEANRVILDTDPNLPRTTEITKEELFRNAISTLADRGYEMEAVDFDTYVLTTKPKLIRKDLAVQFDLNVVEKEATGTPTLVASAQWAPTPLATESLWQEANWTSGDAKAAFTEAVAALHDVQDTVLYTRTVLGVSEKEGVATGVR